MKIKTLFLIILSCYSVFIFAQNNAQFGTPDNPESRAAWELKRQADPETGQIPAHIRERELMFSSTLPNSNQIFGRAENIDWNPRGPWNVGGITRALAMDVNDENILLAHYQWWAVMDSNYP